MNGTRALITGVVGFIFGALSFAVGCTLLMAIWIVITITLWIVTTRTYERARSSRRAAAVGFVFGCIGVGLLLWAVARCCIF